MTKLEKEAEDYAEQFYGWTNNDYALDVAKATYIASAEPRESRIADLEQQIEKMKCCANCSEYDRHNRVCSRSKFVINETLCNCSDGWELRR